ncbi:MAG TPA: RraA family protein [Paludibaculum sp.]|jgi:regulator of RNase E activity RraA
MMEMPSTNLTPAQIDELRTFNSPTISNAIETFDVRPRGEGCTDGRIRCLFPEFGVVVAHACTAAIHSAQPGAAQRRVNRKDYWAWTREMPGPKITVIQDLGETAAGAYWGEVNSNIHRSLGSLGVITNGTVRDLDEVRPLGFHLFAGAVTVSHAYAHLEDFNCPVRVFGMTVHPADLIHADKHGAVIIPAGIAHLVADAARKVEAAERPIIDLCKSADFDLDKLDSLVSPKY